MILILLHMGSPLLTADRLLGTVLQYFGSKHLSKEENSQALQLPAREMNAHLGRRFQQCVKSTRARSLTHSATEGNSYLICSVYGD